MKPKKECPKGLKHQVTLLLQRKRKGKTQAEIATLLGVDVRTYHYKENGLTEFKGSEMHILARYFGMSKDDLFDFDDADFDFGFNIEEVENNVARSNAGNCVTTRYPQYT